MGEQDILLKIEADLSDSAKKIGDLTGKIAELKRYEDSLNKSLQDATEKFGAESKQVQILRQRIAEANEAKKAYRKEITEVSRSVQNAIISDTEYQGSLKGQAALLSQLKDQLRAMPLVMDENGRIAKTQSDEYEALSQRIRNLSDDISRQEQAYGTYSRNVGNYAQSIIQAAGSMGGSFGGAVSGINNATMALNVMSKTPVIGILGLVVTALSKVIEGLKGSEENANRVSQAFAGFKAIGDVLTKGLQALGAGIAWVSEKLGELFRRLTKDAEGMAEFNAQMEERSRLTEEELALNKEQRKVSVDTATLEKDIAELRAKASDKEHYSAQERLAMLEDALKKEAEIARDRKDIAMREYEMIRDKNALTDSSKEELDKEAEAQVRAINAEKAYYEAERSMQRQMQAARNEIHAEERAWAQEQKQAQDEALKAQRETLQGYASLVDELNVLLMDDTERKVHDIDKKYQKLALSLKEQVQSGTMSFEEANYYRVALAKKRADEIAAVNAKETKDEVKEERDLAKERAEQLKTDLQLVWDNEEAKFRIKRDYLMKELEQENLSAEERARLEEQLAELFAQNTQKRIDAVADFVSQCSDLLGGFSDMMKGMDERRIQDAEQSNEAQKESLKRRLDAGLISEKSYNKQVAQMDADLDKKKADIVRKEALRERALSVFEIAVNTAKAVMKIWAEVPKFDYGISTGVLTGLAIAQGAIQSAAILSAPLPKARKGGLVQGATHEAGGVLINTENDERIIGANPSRAFPELLNLISYIGKNIPNTGYAERQMITSVSTGTGMGMDYQQMKQAMKEAVQELRIYTSLTELREAEQMHTTIDNLSKL